MVRCAVYASLTLPVFEYDLNCLKEREMLTAASSNNEVARAISAAFRKSITLSPMLRAP